MDALAAQMDVLKPLFLWLFTSGLRILILLGITGASLYILKAFIQRAMDKFAEIDKETGLLTERGKRIQTLGKILNSITYILVALVAIMMIFNELGLHIGPLLATAGVGGIAIGFGAQSLVRDVISGFFIILENQFRVGDVIKTAGVAGIVESMNVRTTLLRDDEGRVHIIPNGEIRVVTNFTREWSRYVIDLGVAYKEDVDEVMKVLKEIGEELMQDEKFAPFILEPMEILGVDDFGDSQVTIKLFIKTKPLKQWDVGRELRRRIKKTFDAKGIEMPFPHRTIYFGQDREKAAHLIKDEKGKV